MNVDLRTVICMVMDNCLTHNTSNCMANDLVCCGTWHAAFWSCGSDSLRVTELNASVMPEEALTHMKHITHLKKTLLENNTKIKYLIFPYLLSFIMYSFLFVNMHMCNSQSYKELMAMNSSIKIKNNKHIWDCQQMLLLVLTEMALNS